MSRARAHVFIRVSLHFPRCFVTHFAEMTAPAGSPVCDALASGIQRATQHALFNSGTLAGGLLQIILAVLRPALFAVTNKDKTL